MSPVSCIYEGEVRHHRYRPVGHRFQYRLFLMYVDLAELPTLFRGRWLWSADRPALAWFRRADHLGPADQPLDVAVRELVEARVGRRPSGPIRLLTHFRYFGLAMNPVSFYYCFAAEGRVEFVVAEVNNTPWGEQHAYVLDLRANQRSSESGMLRITKEFHVSPFLDMDYDYAWRLSEPGETLSVGIANHRRGGPSGPVFDATLELRRRPLTGFQLARALLRFPCMTLRVWLAIYWQAFRLWHKGVPYVPHPAAAGSPEISPTPELQEVAT